MASPAAFQGSYFSAEFTITDGTNPIDITGWTFDAQFRARVTDDQILLELTTANTGFQMIDAPNGRFRIQMTEEQTENLPEGKLVFDIMRTDLSPGPRWLCSGKLKVKKPVTRDD
ncbi:MAG TPA: hypothetical protein VKT73_15130 [Xanthobacteraceae bacterium]|nr:hypothetical protein [Xanthobacteraceae bacterium]